VLFKAPTLRVYNIYRMRRKDPQLQRIIRNFITKQPRNNLEAFKEEVSNYWQERGYNVDVIEMALKYAEQRAEKAVKPVVIDQLREQVYPFFFANEIQTADNWLFSLREMLERVT